MRRAVSETSPVRIIRTAVVIIIICIGIVSETAVAVALRSGGGILLVSESVALSLAAVLSYAAVVGGAVIYRASETVIRSGRGCCSVRSRSSLYIDLSSGIVVILVIVRHPVIVIIIVIVTVIISVVPVITAVSIVSLRRVISSVIIIRIAVRTGIRIRINGA